MTTAPMTDRRLIEAAFPLKQASPDSAHEKNVWRGQVSTLHIRPARRPMTTGVEVSHAHLVGSVGLDSVEEVMATVGRLLGPHLKRMPDGEPGGRRLWISWPSRNARART